MRKEYIAQEMREMVAEGTWEEKIAERMRKAITERGWK
jgi:hypothetical protein